jgi:8-oxo-dGTP diphosphatase
MELRERILLITQSTFTVGVSGVVLNGDGEVLLLRSRFRYSNSWQLPGGFVKRGESLEDALLRELREETGLQGEIVRQLQARLSRRQHLDVCFISRVMESALNLDSREVLDGRFFEPASLPQDLLREHRALIEASADFV